MTTPTLDDVPRVVRWRWAEYHGVGNNRKQIDGGNRIAIVYSRRARTKKRPASLVLIFADEHKGKVRTVRLPDIDERHLHPVEYRDKPYPVRRAARLLQRRARRFGSTKPARALLEQLNPRSPTP